MKKNKDALWKWSHSRNAIHQNWKSSSSDQQNASLLYGLATVDDVTLFLAAGTGFFSTYDAG